MSGCARAAIDTCARLLLSEICAAELRIFRTNSNQYYRINFILPRVSNYQRFLKKILKLNLSLGFKVEPNGKVTRLLIHPFRIFIINSPGDRLTIFMLITS